jgi:hypothetical protein
MQAIILETKINSLIRESVLLNVREIEFKQVLKEVYPYFKHAIDEENAKLRKYMLSEGYISHYEYMLSEQKQLEEGWLDVMADVGITAGQMVGGFVGQAAGLAGVVKYTKDFIGVVDKAFLEMVGPLLGLFFSMQALLFPMPAVGTIKGILLGFFKGVGNVISGAGGLLARGVTALLSRGHGFIGKAIEVLGKALKGITAAIKAGGPTITKIEGKVGGSMLSKATKAMGTAMENFMKRLGILKEGLKSLGKKDVKEVPGMVKDILTKAFQTGKDKLDDVANAMKQTKIGKAVVAAKTKAGEAVHNALKGMTLGATDDVAKVSLKGLVSKSGEDLSGFTIKSIGKGRMYMEKVDDAGKITSTLYVSADTTAKIMAKSPVVKKWVVSNLDDTAKTAFNKSFGAATSTTKTMMKVGKDSLNAAKGKFGKMIGDSFKRVNDWLAEWMFKNPKSLERFVGKKMTSDASGVSYMFLGAKNGKMVMTTNKTAITRAEAAVKASKQVGSDAIKKSVSTGKNMVKTARETSKAHIKTVRDQYAKKIAAKEKGLGKLKTKQGKVNRREEISKLRAERDKQLAILKQRQSDLVSAARKGRDAFEKTARSQKVLNVGKTQQKLSSAKGAKDTVEEFIVTPAQFFSSYGHMWFGTAKTGIKKATGVGMPEFNQFIIYLRHIYPPKAAAADMMRIVAASGKDSRMIPGTYGQLEMPD